MKFGGEIRLIRLYTDRLGGTTYTYSNLTSFLTNTPQSIQFLGDVSAPSPFNNGATGQRFAKQEYYIAYAEDEWKIQAEPNAQLRSALRVLHAAARRSKSASAVRYHERHTSSADRSGVSSLQRLTLDHASR